jgi:hypothetical protein
MNNRCSKFCTACVTAIIDVNYALAAGDTVLDNGVPVHTEKCRMVNVDLAEKLLNLLPRSPFDRFGYLGPLSKHPNNADNQRQPDRTKGRRGVVTAEMMARIRGEIYARKHVLELRPEASFSGW